jgi:hypothetical protein
VNAGFVVGGRGHRSHVDLPQVVERELVRQAHAGNLAAGNRDFRQRQRLAVEEQDRRLERWSLGVNLRGNRDQTEQQ